MQTIASLYVRTSAGRVVAFNPATKLPKSLKSLLQAIDGRTESRTIARQFADFGNVESLLEQLESAGLIESKSAAQRTSSFGQDADEIWGLPRATHTRPVLHAVPSTKPIGLAINALLATPARREDAWEVTSASGLDDAPSRSLEESMLELTQQIADIMATFVLTYLPNQAYGLLKELESLRSPAQLKATLPGYEALVVTVGQTGREHIAHLRQLIALKFITA